MCYGVQEVALVNKIFTFVNIGVIIFVSIAGLIKADLANWRLTPDEVISMSLEYANSNQTSIQCKGKVLRQYHSMRIELGISDKYLWFF